MIRKLTSDEEKLWNDVMSGASTISTPVVVSNPVQAKPSIRNRYIGRSLDLHGLVLHRAYVDVQDFFDNSYTAGYKTVLVITGRSGKIFEEFPHWAHSHSKVKKIELQPNKGSWKVWLKKKNIT